MAEVTTRGTGEVRHRADRAVLTFAYRARAGDRTGAVDALNDKVGPVQQVLDRPGVRVRSRNLSVHDRWNGRRRTDTEAEQRYEIHVTELDGLDELVAALVATEPAHLHGPQWELHDRDAATREAQHLAVMEARERAEGYAKALGARLGRLVRLSDEPANHPEPFTAALAYAGAPESGPDVGNLNLEPELVSVHVACAAVWQLVD